MGRKSKDNLITENYVKANIKPEMAHALQVIEDTLGRTRTDVVREALYDYLRKNYSEFFPKSEAELMMQVQEELNIEKYKEEYRHNKFTIQSLAGFEEEQNEILEKLKIIKGKIIPLDQKIQGMPNTNERKKFEIRKKELLNERKDLEEELKESRRHMKNTKRRRAYLTI